jgi:hypothetical protein
MKQQITFPEFSGIRCLMMPYIQGKPDSVPRTYAPYREIIASTFLKRGDVGFLTIDESSVVAGVAHRGERAKFARALHTEAGRDPNKIYCWGGGGWGQVHRVTLERNVEILIANNLEDSCAVWEAEHEDTSLDGDIGDVAHLYPYDQAIFMKKGEVRKIGILTPHESLPVKHDFNRQFLRIVGSGVHGREEYFTKNELLQGAD